MFEIYKSPKNKQFYFRLKARNHQIILASEGYKTKASGRNGIKSVQKNAAHSESSFNLKEAKNGKVFFTLDAKNGEVIGASQMYASKATRSIHRVYDAPLFGPMFPANPACVLEELIDQKTINSIGIYIDTGKVLDEIRIGPTLNSVMVGTQPLR